MDTPVEEFVRLPVYSQATCSSVSFDGKPYLVLRLRLTSQSLPGVEAPPAEDRYVKFVLDHSHALQLARGLEHGTQDIPTLY